MRNYGITAEAIGNQNNILPGTANTEGDLQRELHILHAARLVENTTLKSLLL